MLALLLTLHAAYLPSSLHVPFVRSVAPCARHGPVALEIADAIAADGDVVSGDGSGSAFAGEELPIAPPAPPAEPDPEDVTLDLLEWDRLSAMVASQAGTRKARALLEAGLPVRHDREESELLQTEMEEAYRLEQGLAKSVDLRRFIDVAPLVTHASKGGLLDGENLVGIADSLEAAAALVRTLRDEQGENRAAASSSSSSAAASYSSTASGGGGALGDADALAPLSVLPGYFEGLPVQAELRYEIVQALDESGGVRDSADPALSDLRYARREVATAARRELGRLIQLKESALAAKSASIRDNRYVLQVLAKQRHQVAGTVRDVSASGATLYIEPKALEATNTKLRQLAKREKAIERAVLKKLSALVGGAKAASELVALQKAVTRVDCAFARARYSHRLRGVPVQFSDATASAGVRLQQLRHPLLVWRSSSEAPDDSQMVPMDVSIPPKVRCTPSPARNLSRMHVAYVATCDLLPTRACLERVMPRHHVPPLRIIHLCTPAGAFGRRHRPQHRRQDGDAQDARARFADGARGAARPLRAERRKARRGGAPLL